MIGDLVLDIGLVEGFALERFELGELGRGLLGERLARGVVFGRYAEFLDQRERLLVYGLMVADHGLGEGLDLGVLGLLEGLFGRGDVELAGRVGNVRDLGIGGGILREGRAGERRGEGRSRNQLGEHAVLLCA